MATIVGAIGTSHTPSIGFAVDNRKAGDPIWAPVFDGYAPARAWLCEKRPDVLVVIYNDHATSFFFDHYPQFALGVGDTYTVADEGGGARALPPVRGHAPLAHHIAAGLVADDFDLAYFYDKPLDHGCFSPLSMLWPHEPAWPGAIVPLQVGVLQFPAPSARRCYMLGRSLGRAIVHYPEELTVAIVATGGLSHQVHGERCGFNNPDWDLQFLQLIETDPERLAAMTHAEYAALGGAEGVEVIMWLVMRGALSPKVHRRHRHYSLPSMTGIACAIYENDKSQPYDRDPEYLARIHRQLAGIERLEGTYPYTLARGLRGYRLNKFLHRLTEPSWRRRFRENEEALLEESDLSPEERALVRARDWRGMIHYGASFFVLEKLAAAIGLSNLHVYAAMRGQSLEEFLTTRNAPGALYSVAAGDAAQPQASWSAARAPTSSA